MIPFGLAAGAHREHLAQRQNAIRAFPPAAGAVVGDPAAARERLDGVG